MFLYKYVYQLDNKHASNVMYLNVVQSCDCVLVQEI